VDDAYGRSWHVPNAPAKSVREVVAMLYALAGREPKMTVMPGFMLSALGWFSPLMREIGEMRMNLEKPYLVDSSAFVARFGWEAMPLSAGLERTLDWYRRAEATVRDAT
jgi:nucleoside-diphosphate-sugar epimerase